MGRNEFSCLVLEEPWLFKARVCLDEVMKFLQELYFLSLIKLVDVWEIIIATQPDMYVGRRKSILYKLNSIKNH